MTAELPKSLPKCHLIDVLSQKASARSGQLEFQFVGRLEDLRKQVSGEVRQINELFPEYTPHDADYHLKHLFNVADRVLGDHLLDEMNCEELFLLAVGLYAHDWGMAMSRDEKDRITAPPAPTSGPHSADPGHREETTDFQTFVREHHLKPDAEGGYASIGLELWREYVRETHAARSARRVREFFEKDGSGLPDAAARICVGHAVDFADLERHDDSPADLPVFGETVNLRAVTVYVRLVDLLDIADDRTPFVIWKFVSPRDPKSKMEWAKHRALSPVSCPPYQAGRSLRFSGSTNDHEVYAALEDLRDYIVVQFRGCMDVLARMKDRYHSLDLSHVDWQIAPLGFRPVSIRFEFDRNSMFQILSDEIYQGDSHVFLRELLQNSIDAIRTRRLVVQKHGIAPEGFGVVRVHVEHSPNGDALVTWTDDGVGMDEHVVRNYLAIAGKSYYHSDDFRSLGLQLDPISRFGIGILSCFMVADRVAFTTQLVLQR